VLLKYLAVVPHRETMQWNAQNLAGAGFWIYSWMWNVDGKVHLKSECVFSNENLLVAQYDLVPGIRYCTNPEIQARLCDLLAFLSQLLLLEMLIQYAGQS